MGPDLGPSAQELELELKGLESASPQKGLASSDAPNGTPQGEKKGDGQEVRTQSSSELLGPSGEAKSVEGPVSRIKSFPVGGSLPRRKAPSLLPPRETIGFVTTGRWSTNHRRGVGSAFCAAHGFLELQQRARAAPNQPQHHDNFVLVRCSQQSTILRPAFIFLTTTM
jgi:hypothetical protein